MVGYRRNFIPGGTDLMVTLAIGARSLVDQSRTRGRSDGPRASIAIEAVVILPDHLHAILSLPSNDADFRTLATDQRVF